MASGIHRVYGLGSKGVNLVKSPIHMDDNELAQGQNAEFYRERGVAGLRTRAGLLQHNNVNLGASVNGGVGLPLPPLQSDFFVARRTSTSVGFSWASAAIPTLGPSFIIDVMYAPQLGRWVIIGSSGYIATSDDNGVTWTKRTPAQSNNLSGIAWTGTKFVIVSTNGTNRVQTSPDGITWTVQSASEANNWISVCWAPGLALLVAVATTGTHRVMTSPDGITWTNRTAAAALAWTGVAWSPSLSLLCSVASNGGSSNVIQTSPDGTTWTQRTTAANLQLSGHTTGGNSSLTWSPDLGLFAFPSSFGSTTRSVTTSPDGITWTVQTLPQNTQSNGGVCAIAGGLVIARQDTSTSFNVDTSFDGSTWTGIVPGAGSNLLDACFFSAVTPSRGVIVISDGGGSDVVVGTTPIGGDWIESFDIGTSWAATTKLSRTLDASRTVAFRTTAGIQIYQSNVPGQIIAWDGTREYVLSTLPSPSGVAIATSRILWVNGEVVYAVADDGTTQWAFSVDATSGAAAVVGPLAGVALSGDDILGGLFYMGRLWVCSTNRAADITKVSHIYSLRPVAETAWTTENTSVGTGSGSNKFQFTALGVFLGNLYASGNAGASVASVIYKRTPQGVWSVAFTGPDAGATDNSQFLLFRVVPIITTPVLAVAYYDARASADHTISIYETPDGTTFGLAFDMLANGAAGVPLSIWVAGGYAFATAKGRIFLRGANSQWTTVRADAGLVHGLTLGG